MKIDKIRAMKLVQTIEEKGSLTAAAVSLNSSLPTVVRQLAALEEDLGVTLFDRTTRKIHLTDEGAIYLESARQILQEMAALEEVLANRRSAKQMAPSGNIMIAAPVMFGRLHVMPVLNAFLAKYPQVSANLLLQDKLTDLVEEGIDVAFRIGDIHLPDLVALRIGEVYPVVCASPVYIKNSPKILHPLDLKQVKGIKNLAINKGKHWRFKVKGKVLEAPVPIGFTTNDIDSAIQCCVNDLGVGVFLSYQVESLLKQGLLIELLPEYRLDKIPVSIIYPITKRSLARTNTFIEFAKDVLSVKFQKNNN